MRNGTLYKKLGIPDEIAANGLSGWLRGEDEDWTRFVLRSKKYGIDFMPAGKAARNSADVLGDERMADLLRYASAEYDLVLCSAAAAGSSADALALGCLTHTTILAVPHKDRRVVRSRVRGTAEQLRSIGISILGAVLTDFRADRAEVEDSGKFVYKD